MRIDILTLFPEMCYSYLNESVVGRARKAGALEIECTDIRDYTVDKHNRVDDAPYGGGMGMIMQAQPVFDCYNDICKKAGAKVHLIYLTPQGKTLTQQRVKELAKYDNLALLCGHYEGMDERVIEELRTGGNLGWRLCAHRRRIARFNCRRLCCKNDSGVLSNEECFTDESHFSSLLEYPQYTRPVEWHGRKVPDILLSGHHANIDKWRRQQSIIRTKERRPDMLEKAELTAKERKFLSDLK